MNTTVKPNYWSLLGVSPGCDSAQLKRAFRREARKWHPDLNNNNSIAEERFKLINEAYETLSDPIKRRKWELNNDQSDQDEIFKEGFPSLDEYLEAVLGIQNNEVINVDNEEDEYIGREEFKQQSKPTQSVSNPAPIPVYEDLETIVDITPEQALYGSIVEIEINNSFLVELVTPPFAGDGWRLRIEGAAIGCRDHFIQLRVQTEDGLRIDGLKVLYRLELFPPEALLGCSVDIPTLNGSVTLQVPPNSSSGRLLRLRGRGLEYEKFRGDQIVEIVIVLPSEVNESELALYQRLQEIADQNY